MELQQPRTVHNGILAAVATTWPFDKGKLGASDKFDFGFRSHSRWAKYVSKAKAFTQYMEKGEI